MNGDSANGANGAASETGALTGTMRVKAGLAQMLKGGVIMGESVGRQVVCFTAVLALLPADAALQHKHELQR